jgi:uncharacterized protein (TIGR04255 family)
MGDRMPLVQPVYERIQLTNPPLQLVVVQVQFQPILGIADPKFVAPFQASIRSAFPRLARMTTLELSVGPDGIETKPSSENGWSLEDLTGERRVLLDTNSLSLETRTYERFEDFLAVFMTVLREFVGTIHPGERTRLGLRYVNHFVFPGAATLSDWRTLVRPELLGLAALPDLTQDENVKHVLGEARLAQDESQIIARYGFLRSGAGFDGVPREEPYFLMDIDHFDVRTLPEVSPEAIEADLTQFHADTYRLFRWSLSHAAEARLGMAEA